jgi:hypothetical protein
VCAKSPAGTSDTQSQRSQYFQIALPLFLDGFVLVICGAALGLVLDAFLRNRLSDVRWPTAYGLSFEFHFRNDKGLFIYASLATFATLLFSCLGPALKGNRSRGHRIYGSR